VKPRPGAVVRKQRSLFGRFVLGTLSAAMLAILVAGGIAGYARYSFERPGPLTAEKLVMIERGSGLRGISERLAAEGVISNPQLFMAAVYATGNNGKLKAGDYRFEPGVTMREVLEDLATGKSIVYKVTVPEGWTSQQVVERLKANDALVGEITRMPPEGSLLPETYVFERGRDRQSILDEMAAAQKALLDRLWEQRAPDLPFKTKEEALILASIVEKETGIASERPLVAAVFVNRLRKRMRLQSDPTIIYGLVGGAGSLGRPLTRTDIASKTAYNTYVIDGLPPTPIANPGRASIEAVLNPVESDAIYFVADGSGGHAFANSLSEHQANVRKWRKIERDRRAQAAASGQSASPEADKVLPDDLDSGDDSADGAANGAASSDTAARTGQQPAAQEPASVRRARAVASTADGEPPLPGVPQRANEASARAPAATETARARPANRGPVPIPVAKPAVPGQ